MSTLVFPDVEGGVRTYLRGYADLVALVGARVFFGIPNEPTWPLVVVSRVGGGDDSSDAPFDEALVRLDCWGRLYQDTDPTKRHGDKAGCRAVANAVRSAIADLTHLPATAAGVFLAGGSVVADTWEPDPDDDRPRYSLLAQITARVA